MTEWQEFRSPDFDLIREKLSEPVIVDGRNLYDPSVLRTLGLAYYAIGRGQVGKDVTPSWGRRKGDQVRSA